MDKSTRRSFLKPRLGAPAVAGSGLATPAVDTEGSSRRAFLQGSAGAAAGAAVILAAPKVAAIAAPAANVPVEAKGVLTTPSGPVGREPVTAYVRDADRGEVTVVSGTHTATYRDPALVKRLLDAAQ